MTKIAVEPKKLLTIGGSDSGGSAGIQADLKTWAVQGVHGMSALTVLTAQNTQQITGLEFVSAEFLRLQIETILSDYGADAIKTGFIGRIELIDVIATTLAGRKNIVIDPVLLNSQGKSLFDAAVVDSYRDRLFPLATIVTPNINEAALLTQQPINSLADAEAALRTIHSMGSETVLIKRFRTDTLLIDLFFDGTTVTHLPTPFIDTINTHGSGDTLSATIATGLAHNHAWLPLLKTAQLFVHTGLAAASQWELGAGQGPLAHFHAAKNTPSIHS